YILHVSSNKITKKNEDRQPKNAWRKYVVSTVPLSLVATTRQGSAYQTRSSRQRSTATNPSLSLASMCAPELALVWLSCRLNPTWNHEARDMRANEGHYLHWLVKPWPQRVCVLENVRFS